MERLNRFLSLVLTLSMIFQQVGFAQVAQLNLGRYLPGVSQPAPVSEIYRPIHLRYLSYDNLSSSFRIFLDTGDAKGLEKSELTSQTKELFKYFLIGLTLPNDYFWVNLRPDSESQIIDRSLESTDIGKILLEADLQLKKDIANLTSPQAPQGKAYWDKLYKKAGELFGNENVSIPTLTRPWIVPNEVIIRYTDNSAYIYKATLKVMLEEDYLSTNNAKKSGYKQFEFNDSRLKELNQYSSELIRKDIIPGLTKEVNNSKRYAALRQVYYSLILAQWFKEHPIANGHYASRINSRNLFGLYSKETWSKSTYFQAYKKSFNDGEYNIKAPVYTSSGQSIRSYFSGGAMMDATRAIVGVNAGPGGTFEQALTGHQGIVGAGVSSSGELVIPAEISIDPAPGETPVKFDAGQIRDDRKDPAGEESGSRQWSGGSNRELTGPIRNALESRKFGAYGFYTSTEDRKHSVRAVTFYYGSYGRQDKLTLTRGIPTEPIVPKNIPARGFAQQQFALNREQLRNFSRAIELAGLADNEELEQATIVFIPGLGAGHYNLGFCDPKKELSGQLYFDPADLEDPILFGMMLKHDFLEQRQVLSGLSLEDRKIVHDTRLEPSKRSEVLQRKIVLLGIKAHVVLLGQELEYVEGMLKKVKTAQDVEQVKKLCKIMLERINNYPKILKQDGLEIKELRYYDDWLTLKQKAEFLLRSVSNPLILKGDPTVNRGGDSRQWEGGPNEELTKPIREGLATDYFGAYEFFDENTMGFQPVMLTLESLAGGKVSSAFVVWKGASFPNLKEGEGRIQKIELSPERRENLLSAVKKYKLESLVKNAVLIFIPGLKTGHYSLGFRQEGALKQLYFDPADLDNPDLFGMILRHDLTEQSDVWNGLSPDERTEVKETRFDTSKRSSALQAKIRNLAINSHLQLLMLEFHDVYSLVQGATTHAKVKQLIEMSQMISERINNYPKVVGGTLDDAQMKKWQELVLAHNESAKEVLRVIERIQSFNTVDLLEPKSIPLVAAKSIQMPVGLVDRMRGSNRNWSLGINSSTQSVTFTVIDFDTKETIWQWREKFEDEFYSGFYAPKGFLPNPDNLKRFHTDPLLVAATLEKGMMELSNAFKVYGWDLGNIRAIAGAGQQHGTVYFNKEAKHVFSNFVPHMSLALQLNAVLSRRTSPIWMDTTTEAQKKEAEEFFGGPEGLRRLAGSAGELRFGLLQIMRFAKENKAEWEATTGIVNITGFIGGLLGGVASFPFDYGDAAGSNAADIRTMQWLPAIDKLVPGLRAKLPEIKPTGEVVGRISNYWTKYGFSPETIIVNGSGDNPASMAGQGIVGKGQVGISLGTSFTIYTYIDEAELDKTLKTTIGNVFREPTGKWMKLVCFQNGGLALEAIRDVWIEDKEAISRLEAQGITRAAFKGSEDEWNKKVSDMKWDIFNEEVNKAPAGNGGQMMITQNKDEQAVNIPYVEGKPFTNFDLSVASRPQALRAAVEGQVYFLKWVADKIGLDVKEINLTGGASKNQVIRQIIADVFGANVSVLAKSNGFDIESVSSGAAIIAAKAYADSKSTTPLSWEAATKGLVALDSEKRTGPNRNNTQTYQGYSADFDRLVNTAIGAPGAGSISFLGNPVPFRFMPMPINESANAGSVTPAEVTLPRIPPAERLRNIQTFLGQWGIVFGLISLEKLDNAQAKEIINVMIDAQRKGALFVPEIALRGKQADIERALALIREIRQANPDAIIAAGSVSTPENSRKAVEAGVNIVITPGFVLDKTDIDWIHQAGSEVCMGIGSLKEAREARDAGLKFAKAFPYRLKATETDSPETIQSAFIEAFRGPLADELRDYLKYVKISKTEGEVETTYANILRFVQGRPTEEKTFRLVPWGMDLIRDIKSIFPDAAVTATGGATEKDLAEIRIYEHLNMAKSVGSLEEAQRTARLLIAENAKRSVNPLQQFMMQRTSGENVYLPIVGLTAITALFNKDTHQAEPYTPRDTTIDADKQIEVMAWLAKRIGMHIVYPSMELDTEPEAVAMANGFYDKAVKADEDADRKQEGLIPLLHHGFVDPNTDPATLAFPDPEKSPLMKARIEFIRKARLDKRFEGKKIMAFLQGPFSSFATIVDESNASMMSMKDPKQLEKWLDFATEIAITYGKKLVEAGADSITILEPAGGQHMRPKEFDRYVVPRINRIIASLGVPVIFHACGNTTPFFKAFARINAVGFSLDEEVDLSQMAALRPDAVMIGNYDQKNINSQKPDEILSVSRAMLARYAALDGKGCLLPGPGCEVTALNSLEQLDSLREGLRPQATKPFAPGTQAINIAEANLAILNAEDNEPARIGILKIKHKEFFGVEPQFGVQAPGRDNEQGEHVDYSLWQFMLKFITNLFSLGHAIQNNYMASLSFHKTEDGIVSIAHLDAGEVYTFNLADLDRLQTAVVTERQDIEKADKGEIDKKDIRYSNVPEWVRHTLGALSVAQKQQGIRLRGMDITATSNVPHGGGLSNSAANCCAVSLLLNKAYKKGYDLKKAADLISLAKWAQAAEHDPFVGGKCGLLDQLISLASQADSLVLLNYGYIVNPKILEENPALAEKAILIVQSKLPKSLKRVLINTMITHDLQKTEYKDRGAELTLAFQKLQEWLGQDVSSTLPLTLADLNALIERLDPSLDGIALDVALGGNETMKLLDAQLPPELKDSLGYLKEYIGKQNRRTLSHDQIEYIFRKIQSSYEIPKPQGEGVDFLRHNVKGMTKERSFAILLRRMRHQLTSSMRTPLSAIAAVRGDKQAYMSLITAEGASLRETGDMQVTGPQNGAQDALLDIAFMVAREMRDEGREIVVAGRMEGGGGGGFVGFIVDAQDAVYQEWLSRVRARYTTWWKTALFDTNRTKEQYTPEQIKYTLSKYAQGAGYLEFGSGAGSEDLGTNPPGLSGGSGPTFPAAPRGAGGIDLRYINMATQAKQVSAREAFKMPELSKLKAIDITKEGTEINRMLEANILPSSDRVIAYVSACYLRNDSDGDIADAVSCLVDYFQLEEMQDVDSNPNLKAFLSVIESVKLPI